jgi:hypothetical protein
MRHSRLHALAQPRQHAMLLHSQKRLIEGFAAALAPFIS